MAPRLHLVLALLPMLAGAAPAGAQPSATLDLATVTTTQIQRTLGSVGTGAFGVPVAGGFDCDGDGFRDVAMASMRASPLGRGGAGEVYLVFGDGTTVGSIDTAVAQARVLRILGDGEGETAGSEIWMDDVTGDGIGDLLIARQNFTPDVARPGAGALTIVVGGQALRDHAATLTPLDLRSPPVSITLLTLVGADAVDRLGIWMRTGDVTGDGTADLVVGADQEDVGGESDRGAVYVVRGGAHLAATQTIDLADFGTTALAGHLAKIIPPAGSVEFHFGATCQIADLDQNGRGEVLVAATLNRAGATIPAVNAPPGSAHGSGGSPDGTLYIAWDDNFTGNPWPAGFCFDIASSPGARTIIAGGVRNVSFGEEILGGLDYDADGTADLFVGDIVGDGTAAQNRPASGSGHVLFDAATLRGLTFDLDDPPAGLVTTTFLGPAIGDIASDTALHGDFDGDTFDDLAFSSPHASPLGRSEAGIIHVFHGRVGGWPAEIDLAPGSLPPPAAVRITEIYGANGTSGTDAGDVLCYSAAAGDIDDDGRTDLITNEMLGNGATPAAEDVGNLIVLGGALIASLPGTSAAQTKSQRSCIETVNAQGAALVKAHAKVAQDCLRDASRGAAGKLGTPPQEQTAQACLANDPRRRVARRAQRLVQREDARCLRDPAQVPAFGYTGAAAVAAAAGSESTALVADLFGGDLDAAVVATADAAADARCQAELLKRTSQLVDELWRQARRAKRDGLKGRSGPPVASSVALGGAVVAALDADTTGRIGRRVSQLVLRAERRCDPGEVTRDLATLFPGRCAGVADASVLGACATERARCRLCRTLNAFDDVQVSCDQFDDGAVDASCP